MIWLHIISDLKNINFDKLELNNEILKKNISLFLNESWLSELGSYYHTFNNKNEITCIIALAESHISIHTWPEKKYVSLDIFVCNFWENNSKKAKELYKKITNFFSPSEIDEIFIDRKSK